MTVLITLVGDGPSDEVLIPIISKVIDQRFPDVNYAIVFAKTCLSDGPRNIAQKSARAIRDYPCHLLIVHRDAEREDPNSRVDEIHVALGNRHPYVPLAPIRMTEAWLLVDEIAIRRASGNPNGREPIELPNIRTLEYLVDPKSILESLIKSASGLAGRRLNALNTARLKWRVSENIESLTALRTIPAFARFEDALCQGINRLGT